jgi:PAS domain-containing protein
MTLESGDDLAQLALIGEAAVNAKGVAVFVWDEDRNYVAVNEEACRLTGRTRDELLAMRAGAMSDDGVDSTFAAVEDAGFLQGSQAILRDDGSVEIEWVSCTTRVAGLPYFVSVCWRR